MKKFSEKIEILHDLLSVKPQNNHELQKLIDNGSTLDSLLIGEKNNPTQRLKDNNIALELANKIYSDDRKATDEEKLILSKFSGFGGTKEGSSDEFYTPEYVASSTWDMMGELEDGANILEPSSGSGIFFKTKPNNINLTQVELSEKSSKLNSLLNDTDVDNRPFEEVARDIEDNSLDGVITNVPFGKRLKELDNDFALAEINSLEHYFMIKSLQKLKYGKRAVFIVPTGFVDNISAERAKRTILKYGSFLGAVRMPNKVFSGTGADVATDIVVFEKHTKNVIEAIKQDVIIDGTLKTAIYDNKINSEFMQGSYFRGSGKKTVLGLYVKSEEFTQSALYGGGNRGTKVLTTDTIEQIQEKLKKATKTKLKNTTDYSLIKISGGYNITDGIADKILNKSEVYVSFFRDFNAIDRPMKIKDIKEFREEFNLISEYNNNQVLFSKKLVNGNFINALIAINYDSDNKKSLEMFKSLEIIKSILNSDKITAKHEKTLSSIGQNIKSIYSNKSVFRCNNDIYFYKYYNETISEELNKIKNFITSNWDTETNTLIKLNDVSPIESVTFSDVVGFVGANQKLDAGDAYVDVDEIDSGVAIDNDDIVLYNGRYYEFNAIASYGDRYGDVMDKINSIEFDEVYGVTKEEFDRKIDKIKLKVETLKSIPSLDKLSITTQNVDIIVPSRVIELVNEFGNRQAEILAEKSPFMLKVIADDFRKIGSGKGGYSLSSWISGGMRFNLNNNMENDDKEVFKALLGNDYIGFQNKDMVENGYRAVESKIKGMIQRDENRFNIVLDLFCKQDRIVRKAIEDSLAANSKIGVDIFSSSDAGTISSLGEYMSESWVNKLHTYQNEDINRYANSMSGVVASSTGLGKSGIMTGIILKTLQTGKAKRVIAVVPDGVIGKWELELMQGKTFKGKRVVEPLLREDKHDLVSFMDKKDSRKTYQDFIKDTKKRVLFLTYGQFSRLDFKDETIKELRGNAHLGEEKLEKIVYSKIPEFKNEDWIKGKNSKNSIGYFEDGKFDLMIMDESQNAKNSNSGGSSLKFASSIKVSEVGAKSRIASEYINQVSHNGSGKGTILVTATPFTNTPYEIFTTLKKIGKLDGISDVSEFEKMFMIVEKEEIPKASNPEETIVVKIFKGLKNIDLLEKLGLDIVSYRTAENEAAKPNSKLDKNSLKPDEDINIIGIEASDEIEENKKKFINIYKLSREYVQGQSDGFIDTKTVNALNMLGVKEDDITKSASVFTLLDKINKLSISQDFANGFISLDVSNIEREKVDKIVNKINDKKYSYSVKEDTIVKGEVVFKTVKYTQTLKDKALEDGIEIYSDGKLTIPTTDSSVLEFALKQIGSDANSLFDIEKYPKYSALIKNINNEIQDDAKAKQIVFSLSLSGAMIIENLVKDFFKELKVSSYKFLSTLNIDIKVKDGSDDDNSAPLAKFQEDYNNSEIVTVLVFTKKTSTGVDFNKRTKAIHILDLPYTPDVLEQAKGRAIRQGNEIKKVKSYTYHQDGSFDSVKSEILTSKSTWQKEILENIGSGSSEINTVSIDEDVIAEAIVRFGANFTADDMKILIKEKQDKGKEKIIEQREEKIKFMNDTLKGLIKTEAELQKLTPIEIVLSSLNSKYIGKYDYNPSRESEIIPRYKRIIRDKDLIIKYLIKNSIKKDKNITKDGMIEMVNSTIVDYYDWTNKDTINVFDNNTYTHKEIPNPLTTVQVETLRTVIKESIDSEVSFVFQKVDNIANNKENLKNMVSQLKEIDSNLDDNESVELANDIVNDNVVFDFRGNAIKKDEASSEYLRRGNYFTKVSKNGIDYMISKNGISDVYLASDLKDLDFYRFVKLSDEIVKEQHDAIEAFIKRKKENPEIESVYNGEYSNILGEIKILIAMRYAIVETDNKSIIGKKHSAYDSKYPLDESRSGVLKFKDISELVRYIEDLEEKPKKMILNALDEIVSS